MYSHPCGTKQHAAAIKPIDQDILELAEKLISKYPGLNLDSATRVADSKLSNIKESNNV